MDKTQLSFGKNIDKLKNLQNTTNLLPDTPGYRNLNGIQQKKFIQERNNANTQIQNYIRQSIWALPSENILEMTALDMENHPSDTVEEKEERKMFQAAHLDYNAVHNFKKEKVKYTLPCFLNKTRIKTLRNKDPTFPIDPNLRKAINLRDDGCYDELGKYSKNKLKCFIHQWGSSEEFKLKQDGIMAGGLMRGFLKASDFYQVFPFTKKIHLLSDEFNPPSSPQNLLLWWSKD